MSSARSARPRALPTAAGPLDQLHQFDAACGREDPQLFFPVRYRETERDKLAVVRAKEVCSTCPAATPCLVAALTRRETEGIWGGSTPAERRRMHRDMVALRRPVGEIVARLAEGRRFPVAGGDLVPVVHALSQRGWSVERVCAAIGAQSEAVLQARVRGNQAAHVAAAIAARASQLSTAA